MEWRLSNPRPGIVSATIFELPQNYGSRFELVVKKEVGIKTRKYESLQAAKAQYANRYQSKTLGYELSKWQQIA